MFNTYEVLTLLFLFGGFLFELLEYIQKRENKSLLFVLHLLMRCSACTSYTAPFLSIFHIFPSDAYSILIMEVSL